MRIALKLSLNLQHDEYVLHIDFLICQPSSKSNMATDVRRLFIFVVETGRDSTSLLMIIFPCQCKVKVDEVLLRITTCTVKFLLCSASAPLRTGSIARAAIIRMKFE